MNVNRIVTSEASNDNTEAKPVIPKSKIMSYEEKSVGTTAFFKCEACPYMALAEDDMKFHLFTVHPDLAKTSGLADNIQITCPGCTSVFEAEETLRTHLRNHHKMGFKDVKKMVKSLIQIALKDAKLKKEPKKNSTEPVLSAGQEGNDIKIPPIIEIVPDISKNDDSLPNGVAFISVDELQQMSMPNFEKVDPKNVIEEASINILYTNDISNKCVNTSDSSPTNVSCNILQVSNVTPDLISSIPQHPTSTIDKLTMAKNNVENNCDAVSQLSDDLPKNGRHFGSRTLGITQYKKHFSTYEDEIVKKFGERCSLGGCFVRLKSEDKLTYHRRCHQEGRKELHCPECNMLFAYVEPLHTHLWKSHSIDMELPTCEICGYKTYKRYRLKNIHMKKHEETKNHKCEICSQSFKTTNQLAKHKQIHKDGTVAQCLSCQLQFPSARRLRHHMITAHDKLRPFKCTQCDYTATRKVELTLHMRSHTGDKPYRCEACGYRTADHNALRRHKKRHSGQNLYKCKHCPYTCIQSTVLTSHLISSHPDLQDADLFKCPYCSYRSISKDKYVSHLGSRHADHEGVQLLIELQGESQKKTPSWTIPSTDTASRANTTSSQEKHSHDGHSNGVPIEVDDCDSQQETIRQNFRNDYDSLPSLDEQRQTSYKNQNVSTDFDQTNDNSARMLPLSENSVQQFGHPQPPQNDSYENTQPTLQFLNSTGTLEQNLLQNTSVNCIATDESSMAGIDNLMNNFPIRLPPAAQLTKNNFTLKPVDKISPPMSKVIGPIIKPTQILPVPAASRSPGAALPESEGSTVPRKKPKISVKSNLILKGPDRVSTFHSQQKMAFKRLEDSERFGLGGGGPVAFDELMGAQFLQLQQPGLADATEARVQPQLYAFSVELGVDANPMNVLQQRPKVQNANADPGYIKLEATIKQNTQSPGLINSEYEASPPPDHCHKTIGGIKNELKSDAFFTVPLNEAAAAAPLMDQYLLDNMLGEQFAPRMDLAAAAGVLPQHPVIEIDDNSDDNKLLPRFDINFPLESLYSMHNDFYFLENEMTPQCSGNLPNEGSPDINKMAGETPPPVPADAPPHPDHGGQFIHSKRDPMMNTTARIATNKINVKNIELMKN
ncbi:Transcriptional repressor CTCF [Eumeta japonica]|uniref:Transcriptional repressor CTCF n=1 Tax=Eumeta variegata TaxID=151549 RepID=A0A4C1ZBR0_EUMVA|nr:Transcriptional repressor CTCF [Eumeta japonica]